MSGYVFGHEIVMSFFTLPHASDGVAKRHVCPRTSFCGGATCPPLPPCPPPPLPPPLVRTSRKLWAVSLRIDPEPGTRPAPAAVPAGSASCAGSEVDSVGPKPFFPYHG